jgi:hypothetical protein
MAASSRGLKRNAQRRVSPAPASSSVAMQYKLSPAQRKQFEQQV